METAEVRVETLRVGDKISIEGIAEVTSVKINPPKEGYKKGLVIVRLKHMDGSKSKYVFPEGKYVQLNY